MKRRRPGVDADGVADPAVFSKTGLKLGDNRPLSEHPRPHHAGDGRDLVLSPMTGRAMGIFTVTASPPQASA